MMTVEEPKVEQGAFEALEEKIAKKSLIVGVVGLGYVGLPFLVEKAKVGLDVMGFDRNKQCI